MKKTKIIILGFLLLNVIGSYSQEQSNSYEEIIIKPKPTLVTEIDSMSYALGLKVGKDFYTDVKEIDSNVFIQGFLNAKNQEKLLMDFKEIKQVLNSYFRNKQIKELEEKYGEYKKLNENFLVENKIKAGVKTTDSGLQYLVLKEGEGEKPTQTSKVKVHYKGALIDGTVFDSSIDRQEPVVFGVGKVIKGWTEGLQLMKLGSKYKFFIPQELAYGSKETGPQIKPFSTLIFEVELLEIK